MEDKLRKFQAILKSNNLSGFIVTNPINIFYLTGFKGIAPQEKESIFVFNPKPTLITARLYQNEAKKVASKNLKIKIVPERDQLMSYAAELLKGCTTVGFEENDLRFAQYHFLQRSLNKTLIPFADLIENLRAIKSNKEIQKIEKAQIISQKAYEAIIKTIKVSQTEKEIAEKLRLIIKSSGGQGLAFESIVASGPNSGKPHHFTSDRRLTINDILLLDFGAKYQNYCADLTRTIFIGKPSNQQKNIFHHVLTAQKKALDKITHGIKANKTYHAANNHFKAHKLHKYFIHGLGHGVGLEVHEKPHLRPKPASHTKGVKQDEEEVLQENMIFSIEPGLYFPWGGIRIEDLVVIKNDKAHVLGKLQEEIIEI